MLTDGAAVEQVTAGPTGALSMLSPGTIWIQMSTVGVESCDRLADLAARHGVVFVDALVSAAALGPPRREGWSSSPPVNDRSGLLCNQSSTFSDGRRCGYGASTMAAGSSSRSITGWPCSLRGWSKPLTLSEALEPRLASVAEYHRRRLHRTPATRSPRAPRCSTPSSYPASHCDMRRRTPNSP